MDPKMCAVALAAFTNYEVTNRVNLIEGPAQETLKQIRGEFDIIFIDADKPGYKKYLQIILDKGLLSKNGIIITDNSITTPPPPPECIFQIDFWENAIICFRFENWECVSDFSFVEGIGRWSEW